MLQQMFNGWSVIGLLGRSSSLYNHSEAAPRKESDITASLSGNLPAYRAAMPPDHPWIQSAQDLGISLGVARLGGK
jgi:hypothetical protein